MFLCISVRPTPTNLYSSTIRLCCYKATIPKWIKHTDINRIRSQTPPRLGIIVSMVVIMQPWFLIIVLARIYSDAITPWRDLFLTPSRIYFSMSYHQFKKIYLIKQEDSAVKTKRAVPRIKTLITAFAVLLHNIEWLSDCHILIPRPPTP